ncbi:MAG: signal peptidase I [Gammaproteobacteria bacterium]
MDFALILVVLTFVSGIIWGLEVLYRNTLRREEGLPPSENVIVEYSRSFFPVLLLVLVVRSFLFEPFRIPSSSMVPTLLIGDFIFVNKFTYGLRLPVLHTKIMQIGEPERGDVIVFRLPAEPSVNYIKRLVGLPGDTVRYSKKRLYINGEQVGLVMTGVASRKSGQSALLAKESLGETPHQVMLETGRFGKEGEYIVPEGQYFLMGDNRDNSQDSRYAQVGFVPEANVVGKAVRIWMNWDFPNMPQWGRIGSKVE